jgi:hypothetical protein
MEARRNNMFNSGGVNSIYHRLLLSRKATGQEAYRTWTTFFRPNVQFIAARFLCIRNRR